MRSLIITDTAVLLEGSQIKEHQDLLAVDGIIRAITDHKHGISPETLLTRTAQASGESRPAPSGTYSGETRTITVLSGSGKLLMPGLADCHMHTGQQLLKGQVLDALPMIWTRIMLPFESTLTPEKMRLSAGLAALEMILSGTTAFMDAGSYHMEAAAEVYGRSGLRGILSASTMDEPGLPASIARNADEAIAQTDRLYEVCRDQKLLQAAYSLRSLISCSEELIVKAGARAKERDTLLQAHMNEYPNEVNFFLQKEQCRPLEYLDRLGILGPHFVGAHSLLLSPGEEQILERHNAKVCHCPFSNCGKAVPNTPSLLSRGICVGLGTDGAAHGGLSLWNEMKIFRSVMNTAHGAPLANPAVMPAAVILSMATKQGYTLMGMADGGSLAVGNRADFITIDLNQPHLYPTGNLTNTLLECVTAGDVRDMAVDGRLVMKNRQVLTLDAERILYEARQYQGGAGCP